MNIRRSKTYNTILVTGGTGFVGAYIIRDLVKAGYAVKALRRHSALPFFIDSAVFNTVEWIDCDILDISGLEEAMNGVDGIIHAAAKISFLKKDRAEMFSTNIEGTCNVVNAAIEKNIKRLIHVSSVSALGRKKNALPLNEDNKWEDHPLNTQYALSKYYAEMEVWRGMAEGLNAVIVNPSTVLGYGDWNRSSCALFKNAWQEFPWYTNGINGFVDVEDVAAAIVNILDSDLHSERFILSGGNWSFRQLLNTITDGFGRKRPYREATPFLASIAWRMENLKSLFTGKEPLLTKETAKLAQSDTRFDTVKILKALPDFVFTPLEQTINKACKQYSANIRV